MLKHCLVLDLRDSGNNSLLVRVLHPILGKQEFLAKGGKNIGAKLTPSLQPLLFVNLWLAPARGIIPTIREVEIAKNYLPKRFFPLKFSLHLCELLEKTSYPYLECGVLMRETIKILRLISDNELSLDELRKLWIKFELVLLTHLGVKPSFKTAHSSSLSSLARELEKKIIAFINE